MVAPVFFVVLFGCLIFTKSMIMVSFVEEAAFQAARTVIVPGATLNEAVDAANEELAIIGIEEFQVTAEAVSAGVVQTEIDDATEEVTVTVSADFNHGLSGLFKPIVVNRSATLKTERLSQ